MGWCASGKRPSLHREEITRSVDGGILHTLGACSVQAAVPLLGFDEIVLTI